MGATRKLKESIPFPNLFGRKRTQSHRLILDLAKVRQQIDGLTDDQGKDFLRFCVDRLSKSHSQILQDLFVLYVLDEKRNGFYCDFGATNGVDLSNSCMLERHYDWTGICAEPAVGWQQDLRSNRPKSSVETDCVWTTTGKTLVFNEVAVKELSTIDAFSSNDRHGKSRQGRSRNTYEVSTISLTDLLKKHSAPADLDYLSIDTEGSEFAILKNLDFSQYQPKIFTVEHNFTKNRSEIYELFCGNGYRRVLDEFSAFDDWYVHESVNTQRV